MAAPFSTVEYFAPFYPKDAKNRFIAMLRAYFDDSGTDASSRVVIAGGVLIRDEQHDLLKSTWELILNRKHLPFFHTTKCKTAKELPYSAMSEADREVLLDQLTRIMCVRIRGSFCCVIPIAAYEAAATPEEKERYGSAYAWAVQWCWTILRLWAEKNDHTDPIPFVIESGAKKADEEHLSRVFNTMAADPLMKQLYRLHSLVCGAKTDFIALQCADIIANSTHDIATHYTAGGRKPSKWMNIISRLMDRTGTHHQLIATEELLRSELDTLNGYYRKATQAQEV